MIQKKNDLYGYQETVVTTFLIITKCTFTFMTRDGI